MRKHTSGPVSAALHSSSWSGLVGAPRLPSPPFIYPRCVDTEANYERFPQQVFRPPPPVSSADDCFALRFSLMSESAAIAIEQPEPMPIGEPEG